MSSFAVRVERVRSVEPHPNADRLDLIQVLDWRCVAQKGAFKPDDLCVYFPIDSILPQKVEDEIFGPDAKVKLSKSRVRTIKLRGAISQGLAVSTYTIAPLVGEYNVPPHFREGEDLTKELGVTKYEPPAPPAHMTGGVSTPKQTNPHFHKYTDLENAKNYPGVFAADEDVVVTEKIHGTNFRAGWVPRSDKHTLKHKVLKFLRVRKSDHEFVFGSRNVQMQAGTNHSKRGRKTFIEQNNGVTENVYSATVRKYGLAKRLYDYMVLDKLDSIVVYGEIYGDGIQKNYTYGCGKDERKLVLFDVMVNGQYVSPGGFFAIAEDLALPTVPMIAHGTFGDGQWIKELTKGDSVLAPSQKVREGVVVKPMHERTDPRLGRVVLKFISDEYLLKDQSDFH